MPAKVVSRPRNFAPCDVDYLAQDTIETLRDEFGPGGPLAFLFLFLEAHKQAVAGGKEAGLVVARFAAVARRVGVTYDVARGIVHRAADLGLLALIRDDDTGFTARLLKWENWEPKDPGGAKRKADQRAREVTSA